LCWLVLLLLAGEVSVAMADGYDFVVGEPADPGPVPPADGGDDDVIETGYRHPPRLIGGLAVLALVAVVVGLIVHSGPSGGHQSSAASAGPSAAHSGGASSSPPVDPFTALTTGELGLPIRPSIDDAVDIEVGGNVLYVVRFGVFTAVDLGSGRVVQSVVVKELQSYDADRVYRAVLDVADNRVWLIKEGGVTPAEVIEFDATTLRRLSTARSPGTVQDAVVLDHHLYLATEDGVRVYAPGTTALVAGTSGYVGYIAADPTRDRLLVMNNGFPTQLVAVGIHGGPRTTVHLPFGNGQIAVVAGAIWVGGFGPTSAVVEQLDPTTFSPTASAVGLDSMLGPGALLVATGSHALWFRSGGGGDDLWCLDADNGLLATKFQDVPGPVTSQSGRASVTSRAPDAFAAAGGVVSSLSLGGCPG
jgi:hypothetical protein